MIAPDETTFDYLAGPPARADRAPTGTPRSRTGATLRTDDDAVFDAEVAPRRGRRSTPFVTWGTNPGQGLPLSASVPDPEPIRRRERPRRRRAGAGVHGPRGRARRCATSRVDTVFVGSCTNGRIEDLRAAAEVVKGRQVADGVRMLVVPGSVRVRLQAEAEGLDKVFTEAGAEWRCAGCSMCLGMNPDQLAPGERSASTSNRNFEGRQGKGGRTHLVSPLVAAATAVRGTLSAPADLLTTDREAVPWTRSPPTPASACRCAAATSTPTRSSRPSTSSGSPAPASRTACSPPGAATPTFVLNNPPYAAGLGARRRPRLRHRLVARARRLGADGLRLPGRHLARASPTSSAATPARRGCSTAQADAGRRRAALEAARERARAPRSPSTCAAARSPPGTSSAPFEIDDYTRWRLLEGLDDIGLTLRHEAEITAFEASRPAWKPDRPRRVSRAGAATRARVQDFFSDGVLACGGRPVRASPGAFRAGLPAARADEALARALVDRIVRQRFSRSPSGRWTAKPQVRALPGGSARHRAQRAPEGPESRWETTYPRGSVVDSRCAGA